MKNLLREIMATLKIILIAIFAFFTEILQGLAKLYTEFMVWIYPLFKILCFAFAGGVVDYMAEKKNSPYNYRSALKKGLISGFAGLLVGYLCKYLSVDESLMMFLVGVSGFAGVRALSFLEQLTKKIVENLARLKFVKDDKDDKNEDKNN